MVFMFVYSFPFAYVQALGVAVVPISYMFCFALYGLLRLSHELENPLGWDLADLDLEGFQVSCRNHRPRFSHLCLACLCAVCRRHV